MSRDEIRQAIKAALAVSQAVQAEQEATCEVAAFWRGYEASLRMIAMAFGADRTPLQEQKDWVACMDVLRIPKRKTGMEQVLLELMNGYEDD